VISILDILKEFCLPRTSATRSKKTGTSGNLPVEGYKHGDRATNFQGWKTVQIVSNEHSNPNSNLSTPQYKTKIIAAQGATGVC
jgi:hypothetical protein